MATTAPTTTATSKPETGTRIYEVSSPVRYIRMRPSGMPVLSHTIDLTRYASILPSGILRGRCVYVIVDLNIKKCGYQLQEIPTFTTIGSNGDFVVTQTIDIPSWCAYNIDLEDDDESFDIEAQLVASAVRPHSTPVEFTTEGSIRIMYNVPHIQPVHVRGFR
jgi:hypothetical protein